MKLDIKRRTDEDEDFYPEGEPIPTKGTRFEEGVGSVAKYRVEESELYSILEDFNSWQDLNSKMVANITYMFDREIPHFSERYLIQDYGHISGGSELQLGDEAELENPETGDIAYLPRADYFLDFHCMLKEEFNPPIEFVGTALATLELDSTEEDENISGQIIDITIISIEPTE